MDITFEQILGIVGFLSSLYLGILGIKYTLKYKNKTQLTFITNSCVSLFKAVIKNLNEIEIKFKGKKIDENLIIFKGTIFNSGNIDIDKSIVHQPVSIKLPKNYSWVQSNIIDRSEGVIVLDKIENDKLIFEWDLLKENEYFTFDTLVEYKKSETEENKNDDKLDISRRLISEMKLDHRISNLRNIGKEKLPVKPSTIGMHIFLTIYIVGLLLVGLYYSVGQFIFPKYEIIYETTSNGKKQVLTYEPCSISEIEISSNINNAKQKIALDEFQSNFKNDVTLKIQKRSLSYWGLGIGGFFSVVLSIMLVVINLKYIRDRNLYNKIKILADKYSDLPDDDDAGRRRNPFPLT